MSCSIDSVSKVKSICEHRQNRNFASGLFLNHSIDINDPTSELVKLIYKGRVKKSEYEEVTEVIISSIARQGAASGDI